MILDFVSRYGQERGLFCYFRRLDLYPRLRPLDSTEQLGETKRTGLMNEVPHEVSVVRKDRGESSGEEEGSSVEMVGEEGLDDPSLDSVRLRGDSLTETR